MKRKQPKKILKKIAKFHALFSLGLFILYLTLSLVYSPEFLLSDIRQKFRALADETLIITARVLGSPVKPVVTGEAICDNGDLSINLDWADDENSETFDIDRDGLPLITELTNSEYSDENVAIDTSYSYVVTARGPMFPGSEDSDPVIVTTPEECQVALLSPEVQVVSFDGENIVHHSGTPSSTNRRPIFSGTTNIANANIHFLILTNPVISADRNANANGYWSWRPPINISIGTHNLLVSVVDPLDVLRTASTTFTFRIRREEDEEEEEEEEEAKNKSEVPLVAQPIKPRPSAPPPEEVLLIPLDFSLNVVPNSVFQGKEIETIIRIERLDAQYVGRDAIVRYRIFDAKGEQQESILGDIVLRSGAAVSRNIMIPTYFKDGVYRIQAEIIFDKYNISQEKSFSVLPLPILKLGGGFLITYPELLSRLGTASLWLLLCLIIWLFFFSREYWLYLHAWRHITERNLEKLGLFGIGKGKGVSR